MSASAVATAADPAPAAIQKTDLFVKVPETTLPSGLVVPAFEVGQYLCSKGADGRAVVSREGDPWVRINYDDARQACEDAGFALITESQALALALHVARCPVNWDSGVVGTGAMYRGLHAGTVRRAQCGTYESPDADEQRWFALPNGDRVYDVAGNAYTWVFDDVQGDGRGIVAKPFAKDSPSITTAPYAPEEKGVGWYPVHEEDDDEGDMDWSGLALVRGGCWDSDSDAGVFHLGGGWPVDALVGVGFRCTRPGR